MKGKRIKIKEKFKNKNTKIIIIVITVTVVLVGGYYIWANNQKIIDAVTIKKIEDIKITENMSEEFKKEKEFEGMKIKNISMERKDGITSFSASIANNTDKKFEGKEVKIVFQNEDLTQISILKTKMDSIEKGNMGKIQISTSVDLINAYNFKIE